MSAPSFWEDVLHPAISKRAVRSGSLCASWSFKCWLISLFGTIGLVLYFWQQQFPFQHGQVLTRKKTYLVKSWPKEAISLGWLTENWCFLLCWMRSLVKSWPKMRLFFFHCFHNVRSFLYSQLLADGSLKRFFWNWLPHYWMMANWYDWPVITQFNQILLEFTYYHTIFFFCVGNGQI